MMASVNVISHGDLTVSSETEGTVYVGGNLTSNGHDVNVTSTAGGTYGVVAGPLTQGIEFRPYDGSRLFDGTLPPTETSSRPRSLCRRPSGS